MKLVNSSLLGCLLLIAMPASWSQPDFTRIAPAVAPPSDPAIARAIMSIDPLRIHQTIKTLVGFHNRNSLSTNDSSLPAGTGIQAAADWITSEFERISKDCGRCLEVKQDVFTADPSSAEDTTWANRIPKPTRMTNIYAILRGTDPQQSKRMVLVTGHYDSRSLNVLDARGEAPGANDDASGVAVSLESARVLSQMKFPASLVFVAVAGEEQGLVGSAHLAHLAREQGWKLEAVLNNDIVGGNTTPGDLLQMKDRVRVFSEGIPTTASPEQLRRIRALGEESDSPSRELARAVADAASAYFPSGSTKAFSAFLVARPDRYLRGGDHSSFNHEGFAAVRLTEWREDYNHQHQDVVRPAGGASGPVLGDLLEFVDSEYVASVARLNAATLATLGSAPAAPEKVALDIKRLQNDTTLTWEATAPVDHYDVVWRETTDSVWSFSQPVPPPETGSTVMVTLPVSKDNVVFGVRSVDKAGHRSLVVVP